MDVLNPCPHAAITLRPVPLEVWNQDDSGGRRYPGAQMATCQRCGASFYPEGEEARVGAVFFVAPDVAPGGGQDVLC